MSTVSDSKTSRNHRVISSSKSLFNRALIVKSYFPSLEVLGESQSEDILHLEEALKKITSSLSFDCGEGGTTLRFLSLRLSREIGCFEIYGSPRLMSRPHLEIRDMLDQLGVDCELSKVRIVVNSQGWHRPPSPLKISARVSSQFASALVLNAWALPFDLEFQISKETVSESYFQMTIEFCRQLGMTILNEGSFYKIPAFQKCTTQKYLVELDMSSAFALAAVGVLAKSLQIPEFPQKSLQPDFAFLEILKKMGVDFRLKNSALQILKTEKLKAVEVNIKESPDLFPVLAVLCAFADGTSKLSGAPHLKIKESNRIKKTEELLILVGANCQALDDGLVIYGKPFRSYEVDKIVKIFDPDQDHRMAMAAGILMTMGFPIEIQNKDVVNKSFANFWNVLEQI